MRSSSRTRAVRTLAGAAVVAVGVALAASCSGVTAVGEPIPPWLDSLIARLESEPVANPPAYIARYRYRGRTVYYLPGRCCDVWSVLFEATGSVLCHPDGGISGGGDHRCTDFFAARTDERIIWRDSRTYP